ncbi:MAG: DNA topoisomerase IV subunit B [Candidatus Blackburnbacteria bacterium RIFCSPHIGHO2_01_FULL_43_15b]|uniref:DNA topoisomerase (ATP-hydrolyzing) n=1 Tax=Candidatus Blackburnbacteria bacterium RIFCSPHIGHO2_01_FULL_43_15b TaxID=1797513 RepID=A0A1G1UXE7_9BACT|nr:MAG: DNA topoisomerase IV subunit B [Candidatus Blackburnbacteria bacterium RIFCSPHIGHO2_01_FULL_43_15b]
MPAQITKTSSYTAKDIQVLEGLEPVRKRPGMYIGSTDASGLHHLITEILDNSVDEALAGHATEIWVEANEDGSASVKDNGRGIPVDKHPKTGTSALELTMTKLHAGGKFGDTAYKVSGGLHGVGASVVNALSDWLEVEVHRDSFAWVQKYKRGVPEWPVKKTDPVKDTGTKTTFLPDKSMFTTTEWNLKNIEDSIRNRAYLIAGLTFHLKNPSGLTKTFYFEGGIKSLVAHNNHEKQTLNTVVYFKKDTDDISAEIALQYNDGISENVESFVNVIKTPDGGTHLTGFRIGLTRAINDYAKKIGLQKEVVDAITGEDTREGLTAAIFVKLPTNSIQFESQTKTKLNNPEAQGFMAQLTNQGLNTYFEENPGEARKILEKVTLATRARLAARAAKDAVLRKGALEGSSLPGKLADCSEKDASLCEIYLVEGDSAGGTAKGARDRKYQAILPIGGKILNTERAHLDKIIKFEELKDLIIALGAGIGETTNIDKLRYHRIIIMTDADVDGSHIATLLMTFFYRHLPQVIQNGYLYIALPPLYKIQLGKEIKYAYNDEEKDKIVSEINGSKFTVSRYKGLGEMNSDQLRETTMDPETRTLKQVTIENAEETDNVFTTLMGEDVPARKKFIQTYAQFASLDI